MFFWVLWLITLIFSVFLSWPFTRETGRPAGIALMLFILVGILGWAQFGPPLK
jgi:hypothetical protein